MTGCPHFLLPVVVGGGRVVWGCVGGAGVSGGGARKGPVAGSVSLGIGPAPALAPFPVPGCSSLWTVSCCWGGWLVLLLRGCDVCLAVCGCLQSGAALIDFRLDDGSLQASSSSPTVAGCRLGGFPVRRDWCDWWGGDTISARPHKQPHMVRTFLMMMLFIGTIRGCLGGLALMV
jgi:hypothetical protein